jgi:Periplasmic copper-binding protein (NosD)
MPKMRMKNFSVAFFVGIAVILAAQTSFGQTVAVGNCKSHMVSYSTISAAVAAAAPNSTVLVCPGTYAEQVTITQALTLKGLPDATDAWPVIAVPSGGLGGSGVQLSAQGTFETPIGPVSILNLVVDGAGSGVDCSTGTITGIEYYQANGTLNNVEVRNQNPGGCGIGISLTGGLFVESETVNIRNSNIHDFDNTGVLANSSGASGFLVNLTSTSVISPSTSVQAGVGYFDAEGVIEYNHIILAGGTGLQLENFYGPMTARGNAVVGTNVGILSGTSEQPNLIVGNVLSNNGTGIFISGLGAGSVVSGNNILQSSVEAIDLDCSQDSKVVNNTIFGAPVGVANMNSGDTVKQNTFYNVSNPTTACPQ